MGHGSRLLYANEFLAPSEYLVSNSGLYKFEHQVDGNLVVSMAATSGQRRVLWASGTSGSTTVRCVMQRDGNLVLYDSAGQPVWATNTVFSVNPNSVIIEDDGNLVLYDGYHVPQWATNTDAASRMSCLESGETLRHGEHVESDDQHFRLVFQHDGNLVIYRLPGMDVLWASNTAGSGGERCVMQQDGNLVLYDLQGSALWSSGTHGKPDSFLSMQRDGNAVLRRPDGAVVWASNSVWCSQSIGSCKYQVKREGRSWTPDKERMLAEAHWLASVAVEVVCRRLEQMANAAEPARAWRQDMLACHWLGNEDVDNGWVDKCRQVFTSIRAMFRAGDIKYWNRDRDDGAGASNVPGGSNLVYLRPRFFSLAGSGEDRAGSAMMARAQGIIHELCHEIGIVAVKEHYGRADALAVVDARGHKARKNAENYAFLALDALADAAPKLKGHFSTPGIEELLVYYPAAASWIRMSRSSRRSAEGECSRFGSMVDGRFLATGRFLGKGTDQILFYTESDGDWTLGEGGVIWRWVGNSNHLGNVGDGRPILVGAFSPGSTRAELLFYTPGDHNWYLGRLNANLKLEWTLVGNTKAFGDLHDGRPLWAGRFCGGTEDHVLFYCPADANWWLGHLDSSGQLAWKLADNTATFGNLNDGRPIWIGHFGGGGASVLFYYPGDHNWWLGEFTTAGELSWTMVGNTAGFGRLDDGRPFFCHAFSGKDDELLFHYPGDGRWWLGQVSGRKLTWKDCGVIPEFQYGPGVFEAGRYDVNASIYCHPYDSGVWTEIQLENDQVTMSGSLDYPLPSAP